MAHWSALSLSVRAHGLMQGCPLLPHAVICDRACSCGACGNVCADGQTCCNGVCVDLSTDQNNCGSCNFLCNTIPGTQTGVCSGGMPILVMGRLPCHRGEALRVASAISLGVRQCSQHYEAP